jgi:hypothetical protein
MSSSRGQKKNFKLLDLEIARKVAERAPLGFSREEVESTLAEEQVHLDRQNIQGDIRRALRE